MTCLSAQGLAVKVVARASGSSRVGGSRESRPHGKLTAAAALRGGHSAPCERELLPEDAEGVWTALRAFSRRASLRGHRTDAAEKTLLRLLCSFRIQLLCARS